MSLSFAKGQRQLLIAFFVARPLSRPPFFSISEINDTFVKIEHNTVCQVPVYIYICIHWCRNSVTKLYGQNNSHCIVQIHAFGLSELVFDINFSASHFHLRVLLTFQ